MNAAAGDFLLPVDKPEGPTSHDVVTAARRALRTRKVGHTGTLDPFASGLLLLCVGRATRLAEYVSGLDKCYEAVARLGTTTDTLDRCGEVVAESSAWGDLREADIEAALSAFRGDIDQIPPQYSAKKVGGEAMHRKARRGERVELSPVRITVHEARLAWVDLPHVGLAVRCSSGTYIRGVARDLGEALGVGAHLSALRRTAVGRFRVQDALVLDALDREGAVEAALIEPADAVGHLPAVEIDENAVGALRDGRRIPVGTGAASDPLTARAGGAPNEATRVPVLVAVTRQRELLAIAELEAGMLKPLKVFAA